MESIHDAIMSYGSHGDGPRSRMIDMLADMQHYCKNNKFKFQSILHTATQHYRTELGELQDDED